MIYDVSDLSSGEMKEEYALDTPYDASASDVSSNGGSYLTLGTAIGAAVLVGMGIALSDTEADTEVVRCKYFDPRARAAFQAFEEGERPAGNAWHQALKAATDDDSSTVYTGGHSTGTVLYRALDGLFSEARSKGIQQGTDAFEELVEKYGGISNTPASSMYDLVTERCSLN